MGPNDEMSLVGFPKHVSGGAAGQVEFGAGFLIVAGGEKAAGVDGAEPDHVWVVFAAVFDNKVDEGTVEFGGVFVPVGAVEDFGVSQDGVESVGVFFAKEFESGGEEVVEFHEGFFELVLVGESGRVAVPVSECFGVVGAEDFPGIVE